MSELLQSRTGLSDQPLTFWQIGKLTIPQLIEQQLPAGGEEVSPLLKRQQRQFLRGWFRIASHGLLEEAEAAAYIVDTGLAHDNTAAARALANTVDSQAEFPVRLYPFDMVHASYGITFTEEAGERYLAFSYLNAWSYAIWDRLSTPPVSEQSHSLDPKYLGGRLLDD